MKVKDRFGSILNIRQVKSGKVGIVWGSGFIELTKSDSMCFSLYNIEDFDVNLYNRAYEDAPQDTKEQTGKSPNKPMAAEA